MQLLQHSYKLHQLNKHLSSVACLYPVSKPTSARVLVVWHQTAITERIARVRKKRTASVYDCKAYHYN